MWRDAEGRLYCYVRDGLIVLSLRRDTTCVVRWTIEGEVRLSWTVGQAISNFHRVALTERRIMSQWRIGLIGLIAIPSTTI